MKAEDRILFACARQELLPRHRDAIEALARERPIRWELVATTAERNGVAPIVGANLRRCDQAVLGLPAPVAGRLELALYENAAQKERDRARLAAALARLAEVGLEAMLLKGAALGLLVYREPWVTTSSDVDLVVRPRPGRGFGPEEKAVRLALYLDRIECDPLTHHDVTMNGTLPVPFERIWRDARRVSIAGVAGGGGVDAYVMSPEDLLLSLAIGSCRKRFFKVKTLFDVAETVRRCRELDWGLLARHAREARAEAIAYAALLAADATLGCELPAGALDALAVPKAKAALIRALIAGFLRTGSLDQPAAGTRRPPGLSLALPYACFRFDQAWRSARTALAQPPVRERIAALEALASAAGQRASRDAPGRPQAAYEGASREAR